MGVGGGLAGEFGLNVASFPLPSTAVHCDWVGQATSESRLPVSIPAVGLGLAIGRVGSNVTTLPLTSTAAHSVVDGQATPLSPCVSGLAIPGDGVFLGLIFAAPPAPS